MCSYQLGMNGIVKVFVSNGEPESDSSSRCSSDEKRARVVRSRAKKFYPYLSIKHHSAAKYYLGKPNVCAMRINRFRDTCKRQCQLVVRTAVALKCGIEYVISGRGFLGLPQRGISTHVFISEPSAASSFRG